MGLRFFWLIPLLPAFGVLVNGLLGRRFLPRRTVQLVACLTVLASFGLSVAAFIGLAGLPPEERRIEVSLYELMAAGDFHLPVKFLLDPLSSVMTLVVTGVGFLIHVYSIGYMAHEKTPVYRFFTFLNLFTCAMLLLVLGGNFVIMFVGWEGVGLCSYLLIGYWFWKDSAATAGKKAFVVNRIGDFGFLLGMFLIFTTFGTLDFGQVMAAAPERLALGGGLATAIGLLLFVGATGKSAQIPLFVWLPDAMEGPTPVSALIHAATMVTAGVYMVARCSALYLRSPAALLVVATIGGLTAIVAASIALVQNDIKKVLAYSTVSQLGYMFLGAGVAAFGAGVFHLVTHAFFKGLLFLGAGSVIHGVHEEQDMRRMGGLRRQMPVTHATMLVATLAIAGIPFFAGFFSKDEILWEAFASPFGRRWLWAIGLAAALMTSFYMFRLLFLTFYGRSRVAEGVHPHESPRTMTVPLMVLAVLAAGGGLLGLPLIPGANLIHRWLEPVFAHRPALGAHLAEAGHHGLGLELALMGVSVAIAAAGLAVAFQFYIRRPELPGRLAGRLPRLYGLLAHKYYVDEIYERLFVRGTKWLGNRLWAFDHWVVDMAVNGVAYLTRLVAGALKAFDLAVVDGGVNSVAWIVRLGGRLFRRLQTGFVQSYALVFGLSVLAAILLIIVI